MLVNIQVLLSLIIGKFLKHFFSTKISDQIKSIFIDHKNNTEQSFPKKHRAKYKEVNSIPMLPTRYNHIYQHFRVFP